jgi:hypothetical protein
VEEPVRTLSVVAVVSLSLLSADRLGPVAPAAAEEDHRLVLTFEPRDYIAASLAPGGFPASFPAGVGQMTEPAIQRGLLLAGKIRDEQGAVIGFATEQADVDFAALVSTSTWTITIPGRGALFLSQREDLTLLFQIIGDLLARGEYDRSYDPPLETVTTLGAGDIVGGSGEFAHAHGTFVERDFVHHLSLATGALAVTDRLELDLHGTEP